MIAYQDGRWVDESEVRVPVDDPGFLLGDGVFESVRLHAGAPFRLDAHLERLDGSAAVLRLPLPPRDRLRELLRELANRAGVVEASLRLIVTRGSAAAGPGVIALVRPLPSDWRERAARGWRVVTARTRHPAPATLPPQLKSLGRVHSVIARLEAADAGVDDVLLLAHDDIVAEGPTWNVFVRVDGELVTPSLDAGILAGVTRATVLEVAAAAGVPAAERRFGTDALDRADAAVATMSSLGVVPIVELDGRELPGSRDVAETLQRTYWEAVDRETHGE